MTLELTLTRLRENRDGDSNAILAFDEEVVRASEPVSGPLEGTAVAVKDNICTLEYPTTCGSRILEGYRSPFEATAVRRIREAGGIIACKTNLDEFAMGSSTEHSAFGRTLHPIDRDRVPGGSSGGSAALVATGAIELALGSETGGSVRQPAAFCGVVGIKPTYGRVSRYGLVAFGSSLDQIGILGRDVASSARLLAAISGRDPLDSTSAESEPLQLGPAPEDLEGVRIGLPKEYFPDDLDPGVARACERAREKLAGAGAELVDVSLPNTALAIPTYYVIAPAEASSNLARYDGVRYGPRPGKDHDFHSMIVENRGTGFGDEVKRRIIIGTYVLSSGYYEAYYGRAQAARGLIAADFDRAFERVDLLFTPTTPTVAFRAGERTADPVMMYLADIFTCPANLSGVPAISVPVGRSEGLPVGGQLIAPRFAEDRMIGCASVLETVVDGGEEV